MTQPLVLSLFPGIGLLDRAFEEEGFCVVRGPDVLWGGDIRRFHPPGGVFAGVIGGPPCQPFTKLVNLVRAQGHEPRFGNLIPEYERCVREARPIWFFMEEVEAAPVPELEGYLVHTQTFNNRWLGEEQNRVRQFSFGTRDGRRLAIETVALEAALLCGAVVSDTAVPRSKRQWSGPVPAVTSNVGGRGKRDNNVRTFVPGAVTSSDGGASKRMWRYTVAEALRLQGLPEDFFKFSPFTVEGQRHAVAQGVPLPMGRAVARAVKRAMYGGCLTCGGRRQIGWIDEDDVGVTAPCPDCVTEASA